MRKGMNEGEKMRQKFFENMRKIEMGARLKRMGGTREWIVLACSWKRKETSAYLTIGCGLKVHDVIVPIGGEGPYLMDAGLTSLPPNTELR